MYIVDVRFLIKFNYSVHCRHSVNRASTHKIPCTFVENTIERSTKLYRTAWVSIQAWSVYKIAELVSRIMCLYIVWIIASSLPRFIVLCTLHSSCSKQFPQLLFGLQVWNLNICKAPVHSMLYMVQTCRIPSGLIDRVPERVSFVIRMNWWPS